VCTEYRVIIDRDDGLMPEGKGQGHAENKRKERKRVKIN
jgi:hypothetical protein